MLIFINDKKFFKSSSGCKNKTYKMITFQNNPEAINEFNIIFRNPDLKLSIDLLKLYHIQTILHLTIIDQLQSNLVKYSKNKIIINEVNINIYKKSVLFFISIFSISKIFFIYLINT